MKFSSPELFLDLPSKTVTLFGMSGVGKTTLSERLVQEGWFHYCVDYRIATRYLNEPIQDWLKQEALLNPLFRTLIAASALTIKPAFELNNIVALSKYLGKPGNPALGGLSFEDYCARQEKHLLAERAALQDLPHFVEKAQVFQGVQHMICDASGSLCEVIDLDIPHDPILKLLCENSLLLYIKAPPHYQDELIARFKKSPKPIYYHPQFLVEKWHAYKVEKGIVFDKDVDPDDFSVWAFAALLSHRLPRYERLARAYGYVLPMEDLSSVSSERDFFRLICQNIEENANKDS